MRRHLCWLFVALALMMVPVSALAVTAEEIEALNNRAVAFYQAGDYKAALEAGQEVAEAARQFYGETHLQYGVTLSNLAEMNRSLGNLSEAERLYTIVLPIYESTIGPEDPNYATALNNLGLVYFDQGRFALAEPLFDRSLDISRRKLGPNDAEVARLLNNLGNLYAAAGRNSEAERAHKQALEIRHGLYGDNDYTVAQSLNNLARLYQSEGRAETEVLYHRAIVVAGKTLPPNHPFIGSLMTNLGEFYVGRNRFDEASRLFQAALVNTRQAYGDSHYDVAKVESQIGGLAFAQGNYTEAETHSRKALAIFEKLAGSALPLVGQELNNLAIILQAQGEYGEAEATYVHALQIQTEALGISHPYVIGTLNNFSSLHVQQQHWPEANVLLRRAAELTIERTRRGNQQAAQPLTGRHSSDADRASFVFALQAKVARRLTEGDPERANELIASSFEAAQWATTSAAARALALSAARQASGSRPLAALVRERQDLLVEWQDKDQVLLLQRHLKEGPDRDATAEAATAARLAAIDARIAAIDQALAREFPDYAALASSEPVTLADSQAVIGEDEALVLTLDTPEFQPMPRETLLWVLTRRDARWIRSALDGEALGREVAALRCGLDMAAWLGAGEARCQELLGTDFTRRQALRNDPLPFDLDRAHALYRSLFGGAEDLIAGKKHLLVVPSGPLAQLPFQVLLSAPPDPELGGAAALRAAAWLIRDHAITVLPSVGALKALRDHGQASGATRTMIGFGNPVLDGDPARTSNALGLKLRRAAARYRQSCDLPLSGDETLLGLARATLGADVQALGEISTSEDIRRWAPVPGTGRLLCDIADDPAFEADSVVFLADQATKSNLSALSEAGELAKYRIVHFATHGVLAGQVKGIDEPGLILTPPATESPGDNGYLSASDITGLKLDADWVILSACNTAAGGSAGGEALSGLARAFFYAQARALLVSHWAVYEDAAVALVGDATRASAGAAGRSEALRQAMLKLLAGAGDRAVHPTYWAPFVVVGEGASLQ